MKQESNAWTNQRVPNPVLVRFWNLFCIENDITRRGTDMKALISTEIHDITREIIADYDKKRHIDKLDRNRIRTAVFS